MHIHMYMSESNTTPAAIANYRALLNEIESLEIQALQSEIESLVRTC